MTEELSQKDTQTNTLQQLQIKHSQTHDMRSEKNLHCQEFPTHSITGDFACFTLGNKSYIK